MFVPCSLFFVLYSNMKDSYLLNVICYLAILITVNMKEVVEPISC